MWEHQSRALENSRARDYYALFFDCGTGKTLTAIQIFRKKMNEAKRFLPTLILGPPIIVQNWKEEILKFSKIPEDKIITLQGPVPKRMESFKKALDKHQGEMIVVTNYEGLVSYSRKVGKQKAYPFLNLLLSWSPKILIADESHMLKSHTSIRTKLITKLAKQADYRYILTGTPVSNSMMDLFSQFLILDRGENLGSNFYEFRGRFFYDANAGMPKQSYFPKWLPREDTLPKLNEIIHKVGLVAKKEDCLDLPPFVRKEFSVEMAPDQKRMYKEMESHFVAFLEEDVVAAELSLTKVMRMMQIVTGHYKTVGDEVKFFKKNPRKDALKQILQMIPENSKILIWACFKANYEDIREVCNELKIGFVEATGESSSKEKDEAVNRFNRDDNIRVFIGHPASLGVGINLVISNFSIYYSRSYSLIDDIQSEARNFRGGSEVHSKITRIDLVTRDTVDESILEALKAKMKTADAVMKKIVANLKSLR